MTESNLPSEKFSLTQVFTELCPVYMNYGMTYEQYWYGDPWMVRAFAQAYLIRRRVDNETAWINGLYTYSALSAALTTALSNKRKEYVKQPLELFPKTEMEQEEDKRQKRRKLVAFLDSLRIKQTKTGEDQNVSKP